MYLPHVVKELHLKTRQRVGFYAGTFNPVHAGHISFALQAAQAAKLDKLYFVPERQPRGKAGVEHFGHRVGMLRQALQPHPHFDVLELVDVNLSVVRTFPKLQQQFYGSELVFLFGSDVVSSMAAWPNIEQLLMGSELVIGLRHNDTAHSVQHVVAEWSMQPKAFRVVSSYAPNISSGRVREALYQRRWAKGLLPSVERYSRRHWLYVSVG